MTAMDRSAVRALVQDLKGIYYRCGREVTRKNKYGEEKPYWPKRYWAGLLRAERLGDHEVVAYVKRIVTRRRPTRGFGELVAKGRADLTVEALVVDSTKPYHSYFDAPTVSVAQERLAG
jgi:hypothetical protein